MSQALLGGRYRLGERIAAGGMGAVHRGVDQVLGRPVAVKVLKRELADDPTFLERFRREARAAAAVAHPGVAGVYDYGELGDQPFIVMELVEGETLAERLASRGRLGWREALAIGEQVARALAAAHAHGLVHRDVKPANVLLGSDGHAKVVDFGIAQAAQAATLTASGVVLGSADYVAPEQARGGHVGPGADLYSLGCVLFEAVTGQTPYTGANAVAIATQHVSGPVPDPLVRRPDLPAPVAALIARALAKDPADRFPSAAAMADALAAARAAGGTAAGGGPTRVLPVAPPAPTAPGPGTPPTPPAPWALATAARPRRRAVAAVLAVALVLIALLLLAWLPRSHPPASPAVRSQPASGSTAGSSGSGKVRVPDVVGAKLDEATGRLRDLGLAVQVQGAPDGRGGRELRVTATSPAAGSLAPRGSVVRLQVADGKGKGKGGEED
jgi:serine/threonine protein kinase